MLEQTSWRSEGYDCQTYPQSTLVGCFCLDAVVTSFKELGLVEGAQEVATEQGEMCTPFLKDYAAANAVKMLAVRSFCRFGVGIFCMGLWQANPVDTWYAVRKLCRVAVRIFRRIGGNTMFPRRFTSIILFVAALTHGRVEEAAFSRVAVKICCRVAATIIECFFSCFQKGFKILRRENAIKIK